MFNKTGYSFSLNWHYCLYALLMIAMFIHVSISLHNNPGFWSDSFIYLLQADYFSNRNTAYNAVLDQAMAYRNFPPLFPYFLSLLGAGSDSIIFTNIITSILLLPVSLLYINWQVREGIEKKYALFNAIFFLFLPGTLLLSTEVWSENLYLLFVFATFWSFSKSENKSNKWLYISALTCGLALITRSVGIALVVALMIAVGRQNKRNMFVVTAIIFLPWLIWLFISSGIDYSETYLKNGFFERQKNLLSINGEYLNNTIVNIEIQLKALWWAFQLQFSHFINSSTAILAMFLIITVIPTLLKRVRYIKLDAFYFILYFGIIFLWNFPDQNVRFIYVIVPLILFYSQVSVLSLPRQDSKYIRKIIKTFIPSLMIFTILPSFMLITDKLISPPGEHVHRIGNERLWLTGVDVEKTHKRLIYREKLIESAIKIKAIVPQEECVYSVYNELIMLYGQRRSFVPPLEEITQKKFINELTLCRYIFVIAAPHKKNAPMYPIDRVQNISIILNQSFYPPEYGGGIISVLLEIDKEITE